MDTGSGLGSENRISPLQLTSFLNFADQEPFGDQQTRICQKATITINYVLRNISVLFNLKGLNIKVILVRLIILNLDKLLT